jgi:acetoin utilization deacetylase AcuC-like enzyme
MHHGMAHFGHGFCPLNDIVVALRRLRAERRTGLAWVVDVDAHRGDGTAALCLGDPAVLCLSAHMARGWPLDREPLDAQGRLHPSFLPGDVDIPVPEGGGAHYVECLRRGLNLLESLSFGRRPDLAVVVAGSDAWEGDGLESAKPLRLSLEQMLERDLLVYDTLSGLGVPQAWLMAGGYGPDSWRVYAQFLEHVLPERLPLQAPDAGMP